MQCVPVSSNSSSFALKPEFSPLSLRAGGPRVTGSEDCEDGFAEGRGPGGIMHGLSIEGSWMCGPVILS
jgi:hypothetical protein